MIRFLIVALFVVLFLILSIPLLIAEWIIGRFNPALKDKSSLAIVNWAFRQVLRLLQEAVGPLAVPQPRPAGQRRQPAPVQCG